MKKSILFTIAILGASTLCAQKDSLNAVIQVENEYNPVVTKAAKKGFTPSTEQNNDNTPLELEFSQKATPFTGFVGERDVKDLLPKQNGNYPGYARLGYGTGNNVDAKLSYLFNLSEKDKLNAVASLEGFNTKMDSPVGKWDSRFYSSWAGAEYSHKFDDLLLKSNFEWSNDVFNYNTSVPGDKQNVQRFHIGAGAVSSLTGPFSYEAGVRFTRNHYRHLPFLFTDEEAKKGHFSENIIGADAEFKYELTDNTIRDIVTGVTFNNYSYSNLEGAKNFAEFNINPAANIRIDMFNIRVGAQLNMMTRGTFLAVAPDIYAEVATSDAVTVYTSIKGGRTATGFKAMEEVSPYWSIDRQPDPVYTVADITAGARISRAAFSANMYVGYAYTKDDLLDCDSYIEGVRNVGCNIVQENTARAYIGGRAGYDHEGWLKVSAAAKYSYWKCDNRYLLGTKPEFEFELNGEARVLDDIYINATYSFATYAYDDPSLNKNELNLRTTYKFADRFSAFVEGNNLLNREYVKYAGYYEQGINVLLGLSASF